ncbi:MAG: XRE family transcriptional regulator, partial [Nocardia sp.]|nr:XRE family transcriptional regulator [Nocardia sp.]
DLVATLRNIEAAYMEFQRVLGTGTKRRQNLLRHIESETQIVRWFEPIIIPGVLQTPEYIEWILSQVIGFYGIPDDLEQGVAARVERQKVLYDRRKRFSFIIAEQALHTSAGSDEVMIGQLDRLLTAMSLPRVNVAILPQQAAYRAPTVHGFVMYDKRIVLVETVSAELTVTQPAEIGLYGKAFDTLTRQAVTGEQARALIRKAIDARGNR